MIVESRRSKPLSSFEKVVIYLAGASLSFSQELDYLPARWAMEGMNKGLNRRGWTMLLLIGLAHRDSSLSLRTTVIL